MFGALEVPDKAASAPGLIAYTELWRTVERVMCIEPTLVPWQNRRQWPLPESLRCATEGPLLAYCVEKPRSKSRCRPCCAIRRPRFCDRERVLTDFCSRSEP